MDLLARSGADDLLAVLAHHHALHGKVGVPGGNADEVADSRLRVKGDGRTYYLNLRTSSYSAAGSYRAAVKTQKDTWQEVRIPLENFKYAAFGRPVAGTPMFRQVKDRLRLILFIHVS
jgi:hypothetical protein